MVEKAIKKLDVLLGTYKQLLNDAELSDQEEYDFTVGIYVGIIDDMEDLKTTLTEERDS